MKANNHSNLLQLVASGCAKAACCLAAALALTGSTALEAAITGQWDFKSGDLSATIGLPLEFFDYPGGDTDQQTVFGTTTALGLPDIGGAPAHVMGFPKSLPHMGYVIYPNMHSNGGGAFVNQYTLIFDLLYPPASSTGWRALIQINDPYNTDDADLFINPTGGIGISAQYHGVVQANTWHRLAFAFDLAAPGGPTLSKYIDGALVNRQILGAGVDGRWALNAVDGMFAPMALLFTTTMRMAQTPRRAMSAASRSMTRHCPRHTSRPWAHPPPTASPQQWSSQPRLSPASRWKAP